MSLFLNESNKEKGKGLQRYGDASFKKEERLRLFSDFQRIKNSGIKFSGKYMTLLVAEPVGQAPIRVGIICSRKFSKKATERNKVKRILKEVFRNSKAILEKCEILIIPKKTILIEKDISLIQKEFLSIMKEAGKCLRAPKN